ncbi:MAG TPA: alcohol dehydrogenase catalytic domain-containing protein [Thermodesulfobacteriota bacterium]
MTGHRAAVLYGPEDLRVVEVERPGAGPGEVVVRVMATALCGSDVHAYLGRLPRIRFPQILGHELAGVVVEAGAGVAALRVGDRVCIENHMHCGACEFCLEGRINICRQARSIGFSLPGGFGQHVVVPERFAVLLPDSLSFEAGALIQPLSVAYHAVVRRGRVTPGSRVLVIGSGSMGLCALAVAAACGAEVYLSGSSPNRLELARRMGAAETLDVREADAYRRVRDLTGGRGVDVAFECAGGDQDATLRQALGAVKRGGRVVQVGTFAENRATVPANDLQDQELELLGARGHPNAIEPCIRLVADGIVDVAPMVTHRVGLEGAADALRMMAFERSRGVKTLLLPNGAAGAAG